MNKNINIRFILANSKKKWNWYFVSKNKAIKMEDLLKYRIPWSMKGISENPNVTLDIVKIFKNDLSIECLLKNPSFQFEMIDIIGREKEWNWKIISRNKNITREIIMENIDINWDITSLFLNPNLDFEFIQKIISIKKIKYNFQCLKEHIEDIIDVSVFSRILNLDIFYGYSKNKNISSEFIRENFCYANRWTSDANSFRPNILSENPKLPLSVLIEHKQLSWKWKTISEVVPMTTKFVFTNQDKINFLALSKNNFGNTKERRERKLACCQALYAKTKLSSDSIRNIISNYL
jgi:hypothetical protein